MAKHAFLSASASHRWLECPPSAKLCSEQEDRASPYAQQGTDCHELCAYLVEKELGKDVTDPTENLTYYDQEMQDCAESYCSFVMEQIEEAKKHCPDPQVLIEQRLDFSRWVENGFGTGDCVIVADDVLQIIDYKHGLGVLVSAEKNPQMMCYALGALELFDGIYDINSIQMTIFQPRRENVSTCNIIFNARQTDISAKSVKYSRKTFVGSKMASMRLYIRLQTFPERIDAASVSGL